MTLRKLQDGTRGTIVIYHVGSAADERIRAACPGFTIYNETFEPFKKLYDHPSPVSTLPRPLYLAGFSEGCQGVRAQLRAGVNPAGVVAADGIHSSTGVENSTAAMESQIDPWARLARQAINGQLVFMVSHTAIATTGYNSTTTTLEMFAPLDELKLVGSTSDGGKIRRAGNFTVFDYPGKTAADHSAQMMTVLPRMLGELSGSSPTVVNPATFVETKPPKITPKKPDGGTALAYAPPDEKKPGERSETGPNGGEAYAGDSAISLIFFAFMGAIAAMFKGRK